MDKTVYMVWHRDVTPNCSFDEVKAVQVYKTLKGARSAIKKYKETHNVSTEYFQIYKDKISVAFGTDGDLV